MKQFDEKEYPVFQLFRKQWALVTAGNCERFNSCTIGWGSMGTLWTRPGKSGATIAVYVHPNRYTCELLTESDAFTVSFFPEAQRKALDYMGSHSGRNEDKAAASGLTPIPMGDSVTYEEAELTFLCRTLYRHPFAKEELAEEIREYYRGNPGSFPPDEDGAWHPHWVFVGEIVAVEDKRGSARRN